jgi:very-short-patch-repair endonuclease
MLKYNKALKGNAQRLRKTMTDAEILLWSKLRLNQLSGLQFYRQKTIGNYVADFYCAKAKLVIEVDGSQHYTDEGLAEDGSRDTYMRSLGLQVLRFNDADVMRNIEGVVLEILKATEVYNKQNPSMSPFSKGRR